MCLLGAKAIGYPFKLHFLCYRALLACCFLMLHLWHFFCHVSASVCIISVLIGQHGAEKERRGEKDERLLAEFK